MGRLRQMAPTVRTLAPLISRQVDAEGHGKADDWRGWYGLARWKHPKTGLRMRVLMRDRFRCQWPGCGKAHGNLSRLVADHKEPHRGDPALFWCEDNLQTLCKTPCHDKHKQALERRSRGG